MRSSPSVILATAAGCALLIGGEATAFAWFLDLMLTGYLGLSAETFRLLAMGGVGFGVLVFAWTALRVYKAEVALAAEPLGKS